MRIPKRVNKDQMKNIRRDIMPVEEKEDNMQEELGLTKERGDELVRITHSIVENVANEGEGRTSCVLLTISGRKDLTDTEKVICSFIFSSGTFGRNIIGSRPKTTKLDLNMGMSAECIVMAPEGMRERDMVAITIAVLMSQLRKMPPDVVREFCKNASELFAKISETGEIRT